MKRIWAGIIMTMMASHANASVFTLDKGYLRPDGAIMTYNRGNDIIDPYFSTKALLTAHDSGMNISHLASGWISWVLARQEADGLISRFCRDEATNNYQACLIADADDSMMALWVELLYRMAPATGLPARWKESTRKAEAQLDSLFDKKTNIYFISKALPVGLLMDNIEIYAALKRIAVEAKRVGDLKRAGAFHAKAARLRSGILETFWNEDAQRFKISTQDRTVEEFYPDKVAQIIPLLHGFHSASVGSPDAFYSRWMQAHQKEWMELIGKDYPWGLVAVVAADRKDFTSAHCWLQQAAPYRETGPWDVLDEAAFQSVAWKLQKNNATSTADCGGNV